MTPLPPYILSARKERHESGDEAKDRATYQTVYAADRAQRADTPGSVAAPTAGLHFTPDLLERLAAAGVARSEVVLHVGAGTFKPVETERLEDHAMHAEWCSLAGAGPELFGPRPAGGRLIAVGTTSARTLESFALEVEAGREALPEWLSTRLLIAPGYRWRAADGMLTNFHLPRSTLLAMVGSLFDGASGSGGVARLKEIYAEAIRLEYRFFSFGDAMLILP
jgi:S-adenosylmethionine:tRNA ribosyltransferase-isomerase